MVDLLSVLFELFKLLFKIGLLTLRLLVIVLWGFLVIKGISEIISILGMNPVKNIDPKGNAGDYLGDLLHAIELFFIAPVPFMIMESNRKIITSVIFRKKVDNGVKSPLLVKANDSVNAIGSGDLIKPEDAEKAFVASLIGVTSTYIVSVIFEYANLFKHPDLTSQPSPVNYNLIIIIIATFIFLIIQINFLQRLKKN